jgi:hypothetical protein
MYPCSCQPWFVAIVAGEYGKPMASDELPDEWSKLHP